MTKTSTKNQMKCKTSNWKEQVGVKDFNNTKAVKTHSTIKA